MTRYLHSHDITQAMNKLVEANENILAAENVAAKEREVAHLEFQERCEQFDIDTSQKLSSAVERRDEKLARAVGLYQERCANTLPAFEDFMAASKIQAQSTWQGTPRSLTEINQEFSVWRGHHQAIQALQDAEDTRPGLQFTANQICWAAVAFILLCLVIFAAVS